MTPTMAKRETVVSAKGRLKMEDFSACACVFMLKNASACLAPGQNTYHMSPRDLNP